MPAHIEVYPDEDGGWSWRKIAGNNEKTVRGESHPHKADALEAVEREFPGVEVLVVDVEVKAEP